MVLLDRLPDPNVIRALKGTVDFYIDKGRVIARSWPQKRRGAPRLTETYGNHWLAFANDRYRALHGQQLRFYHLLSRQGSFTPRDFFMKHFFGTFPDILQSTPGETRIKRQAYPPDTTPYFAIIGLDMTIQPDGSQFLRVRATPGLRLAWNFLPAFRPEHAVFKAARRGITYNRCWHQFTTRNMNRSTIFESATPGDYIRNLRNLQDSSAPFLLYCHFYAWIPPQNDRLRSFSHWYALNIERVGDNPPGTKIPFGIPAEPNLRRDSPIHASLPPHDLDQPLPLVLPLHHQWSLEEPFRDTDP